MVNARETGRVLLAGWLKRSKLTQSQAAEMLGCTPVFMSQLLSGVRRPALTNAVLIERHTGVPAESWLLTDISEPSAVPPETDSNLLETE